jgi:HNH endonuclease/AP2 domain
MLISHEELKRLLRYDPETGVWTRLTGYRRGRRADSPDRQGYRRVRPPGKSYGAHRLAWFYMTSTWPVNDIDHKNGVRDDNRWENLRAATRSQNIANSKLGVRNKSGLKGVSWWKRTGKWRALIEVENKPIYLGLFDCPAAAHFAYLIAADKHFDVYARAR